jgi:DNA-binding response OmpR family regulator
MELRPDLITLDLSLPGISGDEVLARLRAQEATQKVPVVVVSAQRTISPEVRAQAQAIMPKPFTITALLAVIERLLASRDGASGD